MENFIDETVQHEQETETSAMVAAKPSDSHEDDSTAMKDETHARKSFYPVCGLVVYIMVFVGLLCSYAMRVGLSVAIVAMVNQTAVTEDVEISNATNTSGTDQCPRDPALQHTDTDGEFTWDRHQQTAVLAAYYYGTIITPVCSNEVWEKCGPMADSFQDVEPRPSPKPRSTQCSF